MALRKWDSTFSRFWLCMGTFFSILCAAVKDGRAQMFLLCCILFLLAVFSGTVLCIARGMKVKESKEYAYLIVLGAHVQGRKVTDSLARRLERAAEYARKHESTTVIVSGGRGKGEEISEAKAMEEYLIRRGIGRERIVKESRSATTKENLEFSKAFVDDLRRPVAVVSNDFHMYRAVCYAKNSGYEDVSPMAAGTKPILFFNYLVRECFGVWKVWLRG